MTVPQVLTIWVGRDAGGVSLIACPGRAHGNHDLGKGACDRTSLSQIKQLRC